MSKIVDDVKSGLKGIRGAGEAVRGNLMEAADQTFEPNQNHPAVLDKQAKHRAVTAKGKADIRDADAMVAGHEWNRKERATERQAAINERAATGGLAPGVAAPGIAAPQIPPEQMASAESGFTDQSRPVGGVEGLRPHRPAPGEQHHQTDPSLAQERDMARDIHNKQAGYEQGYTDAGE